MMRFIGFILVVLGGLALGWQAYIEVARKDDEAPAQERTNTRLIPPIVSGIMVVSGLLLLATAGRRDED
jgi:hypothetical protein